jgi:hypothetical protein
MTKCKSCGGAIRYAKLDDGELIPLNARRARAYVLTPGREDDGPPRALRVEVKAGLGAGSNNLFFLSHFLTCPNATSHLRKRKRSASEERLQAALDLLHLIEPFFERDADDNAGDRFGRILQAHIKDKGVGCNQEALRTWLVEQANKVRELLAEEGRELFVDTGEGRIS